MKKEVSVLIVLLAAMILNSSAKAALQWVKMKNIYRQLPNFFDDDLRNKILQITPSDLMLLGKTRNRRLIQLFTKEERELNIPCGLFKWAMYAEREIELLGTAQEKGTIRRLHKSLENKLGGGDMTMEKCEKLQSFSHV